MMRATSNSRKSLGRLLCGLVALAGLGSTGCQVDVGGQTLPSPYWYQDDVQYFPTGPDMKVEREANAQRAFLNQAIQQQARRDTMTRVR
jgi:hypothetical protein